MMFRLPLVSFIFIAYTIQATLRTVGYLAGGLTPMLSLMIDVVAVTAPTIAAVCMTAAAGPIMFRRFIGHVFQWRIPLRLYALALIPVAVYGVAMIIFLLTGGAVTDAFDSATRVANAAPMLPPHYQVLLRWTQDVPVYLLPLLMLPVMTLIGGGQEEPGWRGYLQPKLEAHVHPLLASLLVGVLWAFWHWPLFVLPGYPQNDIPMFSYLLFVIPQSIILTWILHQSRGTVLVCMLYHGMLNSVSFATMQLRYSGGPISLDVIVFGIYLLTALGLVFRTNAHLGVEAFQVTTYCGRHNKLGI